MTPQAMAHSWLAWLHPHPSSHPSWSTSLGTGAGKVSGAPRITRWLWGACAGGHPGVLPGACSSVHAGGGAHAPQYTAARDHEMLTRIKRLLRLTLPCEKGNKKSLPRHETAFSISFLITWHIHLIQPGSFQVVSGGRRHSLNIDLVCLPRQSKEKPSHNHFQTLKWLHCHYS